MPASVALTALQRSCLFSPVVLGPLSLRNRVVMAPMTRERAVNGTPTAEMADYYGRRARGGVGLVITEGAPPSPSGAFSSTVPWFFGPQRALWRQVVDAVHAGGARIAAQLWHVGAFNPSLIGMADSAWVERLGPSGLAAPGRPLGRGMQQADIDATIAAYADAAGAAQAMGFDAVEIHAAHGYLPDQFMWSGTNLRTDRYGGGPVERTRFAQDLVRACRWRTGPGFAILFRFSQWKQLDYSARLVDSPQQLADLLQPLADAGVDVFHCSTRRYWEPACAGDDRSLAAWTRRLTGKPVIAVGSVTMDNDFKSASGKVHARPVPAHVADLERALVAGEFDLVAIGRALIANPDWVDKVQAGRISELRSFSKNMLETLE